MSKENNVLSWTKQSNKRFPTQKPHKGEKTTDRIAFITALILIFGLGVFTYRYFTTRDADNTMVQTSKENIMAASTTREQQDPGGGNDKQSGTKLNWMANNYSPGDISPGEYKVIEGDTLWEISEGVYGSGEHWTQLLVVNNNIGMLANGQQALITPGQILTILPM